jgi:hypothetical protein
MMTLTAFVLSLCLALAARKAMRPRRTPVGLPK